MTKAGLKMFTKLFGILSIEKMTDEQTINNGICREILERCIKTYEDKHMFIDI